jgi:hypothetical protein
LQPAQVFGLAVREPIGFGRARFLPTPDTLAGTAKIDQFGHARSRSGSGIPICRRLHRRQLRRHFVELAVA